MGGDKRVWAKPQLCPVHLKSKAEKIGHGINFHLCCYLITTIKVVFV